MVLNFFKSFLILSFIIFCNRVVAFANKGFDEKQIEVSMRMIGHQFLQKVGDSTSRVLPIKKSKDTYEIEFENEFEFMPDQLLETINRVVNETQVANTYIVEVKECDKDGVVYSYGIDSAAQLNMIPCGGRAYPKNCYKILITLKQAGIEYPMRQASHARISNPASSNLIKYVLGGLALLVLGVFLFIKNRNKVIEDSTEEEEQDEQEEPINPNLIQIGKYQFDKRSASLSLDGQSKVMSGKESDLLLVLHASKNETIERATILSKVWGDEGDYIGRTLDVFISKLRKKLKDDPNVKIVNIRGVGYKLVVG